MRCMKLQVRFPSYIPGAFSIGAINARDRLAHFSCQGPSPIVGHGQVKPDFVEANSWGIIYLRKFNTIYFGSIDLPDALPSYVAFKDDLATINQHLHSLQPHIVDGLIE